MTQQVDEYTPSLKVWITELKKSYLLDYNCTAPKNSKKVYLECWVPGAVKIVMNKWCNLGSVFQVIKM